MEKGTQGKFGSGSATELGKRATHWLENWAAWVRGLNLEPILNAGIESGGGPDGRLATFAELLLENETHALEFAKSIQRKAPKQFQSQDEAFPLLTAVRLAGSQTTAFELLARAIGMSVDSKLLRRDPNTQMLIEPLSRVFPLCHQFISEFGETVPDSRAVWTCGLLMDLCSFSIEAVKEGAVRSELARVFKESSVKWIPACKSFLEKVKRTQGIENGEGQLLAFVAILIADVFYHQSNSKAEKAFRAWLQKNPLSETKQIWCRYAIHGEWLSESVAALLMAFHHTSSLAPWVLGFELAWSPGSHLTLRAAYLDFMAGGAGKGEKK